MTAGEARPVVSRRREVSHTSARSLLMTVLGEFVLPRGRPVWTATLVDTLAGFGIEEKSARQALARSAAEGWLASERIGRRVRWSLTPPGRRLLTEGAERIYRFGREMPAWEGTWVVLLVSVPESKRDLRHKLRTQLTWAGFGCPAPGVWISPDPARETEATRIVTELLPESAAMSFVATYGQLGDEAELVARSWDLTRVEDHYEEFMDEFTGLHPAPGWEMLYAQTRLVHEWRRFPFLDPQLPARLLPSNWSGVKAAQLFHDKHASWRDGAQRHWDALVSREDDA